MEKGRMFPMSNQDIDSWDVSSVTDMPSMFDCASDVNQGLSGSGQPVGFDCLVSSWALLQSVLETCP